jgi:hypothetical protein
MPRLSKHSVIVAGGVLCAVVATSVTAATWPATSPVAFTSQVSTANLAIVAHSDGQSAALTTGIAALTTGIDDIRGGKTAAASRLRQIQLTQMGATAARLHAARVALLAERAAQARKTAAAAKAAASAKLAAAKQQGAASASAPSGSPRQIAQQILASQGRSGQFSCLDSLWTQESGWNVYARNPGSGAYGIPQALPGSKMASAGSDWQTSAATQIRWGLSYIDSTYGSPCAAWSHEQSSGWY